MQQLSGNTTFYIARYKRYKHKVAEGIYVVLNLKVGMHRTGNDLYGLNTYTRNVQD